MRRALHGHHPGREQDNPGEIQGRRPVAQGNPPDPRRLCDRPGQGQAHPRCCGAQSLQAPEPRRQGERRRDRQVQHHADRPDGLRQDAARPDAGAHAGRAVHHGRRHDAYRSGLRRRGRREHHPEAAAVGRLQRRAGAARHRLYRRGRQDQPQVRQPVDHARRVGRGRAAGAAQDHGRHGRERSAAGRPQASAAGVPAGRHDQHPVHLRRRLLGARQDHLDAPPGHVDRLRRRGARDRKIAAPARCCAISSPRIC